MSSLSLNRKPLPSSPYPQRSPQPPTFPDDAQAPLQVRRSLSENGGAIPGMAQDEIGGDESFDYITAYVNAVGREDELPSTQGYGQGKFATNLDHGGLR
jgi:hypothetical protein